MPLSDCLCAIWNGNTRESIHKARSNSEQYCGFCYEWQQAQLLLLPICDLALACTTQQKHTCCQLQQPKGSEVAAAPCPRAQLIVSLSAHSLPSVHMQRTRTHRMHKHTQSITKTSTQKYRQNQQPHPSSPFWPSRMKWEIRTGMQYSSLTLGLPSRCPSHLHSPPSVPHEHVLLRLWVRTEPPKDTNINTILPIAGFTQPGLPDNWLLPPAASLRERHFSHTHCRETGLLLLSAREQWKQLLKQSPVHQLFSS